MRFWYMLQYYHLLRKCMYYNYHTEKELVILVNNLQVWKYFQLPSKTTNQNVLIDFKVLKCSFHICSFFCCNIECIFTTCGFQGWVCSPNHSIGKLPSWGTCFWARKLITFCLLDPSFIFSNFRSSLIRKRETILIESIYNFLTSIFDKYALFMSKTYQPIP